MSVLQLTGEEHCEDDGEKEPRLLRCRHSAAADPLDLSASVSSSASICHRCEEASAANLDVKADEEEAWVRYSDMNKDWVLSDGFSI